MDLIHDFLDVIECRSYIVVSVALAPRYSLWSGIVVWWGSLVLSRPEVARGSLFPVPATQHMTPSPHNVLDEEFVFRPAKYGPPRVKGMLLFLINTKTNL